MHRWPAGLFALAFTAAVCRADPATQPASAESPYAAWSHGPDPRRTFFPLAVWLQDPRNAARYQAAGINTYVGLWEGPTEAQLADLRQAGMAVICDQNEVALKHLSDKTIIAWMHGDEPDNAQELPDHKGYGPPITPEAIVASYRRIQANDPTRPVLLNLGQGVAWDGWYGRGVRSRHPEDYPQYLPGCDLVSFDIYPVVHDRPEVAGKLWLVAQGVDRLRQWSHDQKVVWNCIECTRIGNLKVKPTPVQVEAEVWMSLIHGSRGIIYFVHQFQPRFVEAALLADPDMLAAVTRLNRRILALAPVLNSPTVAGAVARSSVSEAPVDVMVKRHDGATYIFAMAMRDQAVTATITVPGLPASASAEVLDEGRTLKLSADKLTDDFGPYAVHVYRIKPGL